MFQVLRTACRRTRLVVVLCLGASSAFAEQNILYAGAEVPELGSKLLWVNAQSSFSNNISTILLYTNAGPTHGFYSGSLDIVSLPETAENGGPTTGHAGSGAFLKAEIVSVKGPFGARFGLWDANHEGRPPVTIKTGITNATLTFDLSDRQKGAGTSASSDPFGWIRNRRFSADEPGSYRVGVRVIDVSTNGPGGTPIHQPSEVVELQFTARISILSFVRTNEVSTIAFHGHEDFLYRVEKMQPAISLSRWGQVGEVLTGTNGMMVVSETNSFTSAVYRLGALSRIVF